jgi:hypothetical protein
MARNWITLTITEIYSTAPPVTCLDAQINSSDISSDAIHRIIK